ncbi:MAG: hypothetical protein OXH13_05375 [Chloroflexi bacterium]|nr:hypothetical protein [Chloroflexota bacterium]
MADIGTFKSVDVRAIWPNEASDFTPWLAEHMDLLGEALGLDLEVERMEASVGPFSLDILARDPGSDRKVVVENQLEATDHDHLGKLLTYAAYFKAHVIVWLAREFRPEHRAVFDWLNDRTDEQSAFLLSRLKLGRSIAQPQHRASFQLPRPTSGSIALPSRTSYPRGASDIASSSKG